MLTYFYQLQINFKISLKLDRRRAEINKKRKYTNRIVKYNKDNKTWYFHLFIDLITSSVAYILVHARIVAKFFFRWGGGGTSTRWITISSPPPFVSRSPVYKSVACVGKKLGFQSLAIRGDCLLFQALKTLLGLRLYIMQEEEVWKFTGVSVSFVIWARGEE